MDRPPLLPADDSDAACLAFGFAAGILLLAAVGLPVLVWAAVVAWWAES